MERKVRFSSIIIIIFFCLFLFWVIVQFLAPLCIPSGTIDDLSGLTIVADNTHPINSMSFPWNIVYSFGDRLCHQRTDRSFFINENQMPFCSRCTAIWVGIPIGLGLFLLYPIKLSQKIIASILLGLVPIGIDGTGQFLGFWVSTQISRVLTGLPAGIITGIVIGIIIIEISEFPLLKKTKK